MTWAEHIASALLPDDATAADANFLALKAAYSGAVDDNAPLYVPPGTYWVRLDPAFEGGGNGYVLTLRKSPIIGAGSSRTIIKFCYPEGRPAPTGGEWSSAFYLEGDQVADGAARIEGLTLEMAEALRGDEAQPVDSDDGSTSPHCWVLRAVNSASLMMVDVRTTGWNQAIQATGTGTVWSMHLERCFISSRGTRVSVKGPGNLSLVDCTIDQDDPFVGFFNGVSLTRSTNLVVIGGQSLRSSTHGYAFHSDSNDEFDGAPGDRLMLQDHYFGPDSGIAAQFTARYGAVQFANCTFEGAAGILLYSSTATHHVSNCVFNVRVSALSDGGKAGADTEVYVTNCRLTSSDDRVVRRMLEPSRRPWYFSNCYFGGTTTNYLVDTVDGTMVFQQCRFVSMSTSYGPILQRFGRIELLDCTIEGKKYCWFNSGYAEAVDADENNEPDCYTFTSRALHVVIERCRFRISSQCIHLTPFSPIFVTGSENDFGGGRIDVWLEDLSKWSDASGQPLPVSDATLIDSELQLRCFSAKGTHAPYALPTVGAPKENILQIEWDADWIELDNSVSIVLFIFMYANSHDPALPESMNFPVGTTLRLYAVAAFTLCSGGNIRLPEWGQLAVEKGGVAALRYSALERMWVVV